MCPSRSRRSTLPLALARTIRSAASDVARRSPPPSPDRPRPAGRNSVRARRRVRHDLVAAARSPPDKRPRQHLHAPCPRPRHRPGAPRHRRVDRAADPRAAPAPLGRAVSTSGPSAVTATVCSKCAARLPSRVTAVQPSASTRVSGRPIATIGSIASTMPSASFGPRPGWPVVRNLRLLVQPLADAVPDELAHDRKPVRLDPPLHRVADVRQPAADLRPARSPRSSASRVTRSSSCVCSGTSPDRHRHRRVAVEPVQLHADVERDDVARPSARASRDGIPCTTSSFTDAHSVAGYPR